MTWSVFATVGVGTFSRQFDSLIAARAWEIGMTCAGWETSEPLPVGQGRHLKVINGGRSEGVSSAAPAAKGL